MEKRTNENKKEKGRNPPPPLSTPLFFLFFYFFSAFWAELLRPYCPFVSRLGRPIKSFIPSVIFLNQLGHARTFGMDRRLKVGGSGLRMISF